MAPADRSLPTGAELQILRVLWRLGPATVREVHDALGPRRRTGYTTVLKLLQIMHQKGLVTRNEAERSHIYRARIGESVTQRRLLRDLEPGDAGPLHREGLPRGSRRNPTSPRSKGCGGPVTWDGWTESAIVR
jgi:hypothetical protein